VSRRAQTLDICSIRGFCAIYPLMACSALPLEIAEKDLTHCYYLAVHCRKDGEIRVATEGAIWRMLPVSRLPALCHSSLLGEGGTIRELPFWASSEKKASKRAH
jgi:hypothetical protein